MTSSRQDIENEAARQAQLMEDAKRPPVAELYFATARAIGTPVGRVSQLLEESLSDASYALITVRLSEALGRYRLPGMKRPNQTESRFERYERLDRTAVGLRYTTNLRDAVALAAISELSNSIRKRKKSDAKNRRGVAFLFRNVMHHEEIGRLRKLYDRQLFLISIHSPERARLSNLEQQLGGGARRGNDSEIRSAQNLITNESEFFRHSQRYDLQSAELSKFVTNVPKTFQYGDLFIDADDPNLKKEIDRFVDLIFGQPFHTPTRDEIGMSDAFSAALQSGNLARQVGAAICSENGDLIVTGTNDVPKPGGGVYQFDDGEHDYRDYNDSPGDPAFKRGFDVSDTMRRAVFTDLITRLLHDPRWLGVLQHSLGAGAGNIPTEFERVLRELFEPQSNSKKPGARRHPDLEPVIDALLTSQLVWGAQFFDVLEYGRTLHAEMDAITSAARKGVSIRGATLYCTTLPCHECAKLIIGAGIRRVIYIEPYEKSRSQQIFDSEIRFTTLRESRAVTDESGHQKVDFVPYVGISPRRFNELFAKGDRKRQDQPDAARTLDGARAEWNKSVSPVRESIISENAINSPRRLADTIDHERLLADMLADAFSRKSDLPEILRTPRLSNG